MITTSWQRVNQRTQVLPIYAAFYYINVTNCRKAQLARDNDEFRRRLNQHSLDIDRLNDSPGTSHTETSHGDDLQPQVPSLMSSCPPEQHEAFLNRSVPNRTIATSVDLCVPLNSLDMVDGLPMSSTNLCLQM